MSQQALDSAVAFCRCVRVLKEASEKAGESVHTMAAYTFLLERRKYFLELFVAAYAPVGMKEMTLCLTAARNQFLKNQERHDAFMLYCYATLAMDQFLESYVTAAEHLVKPKSHK